MEYQEKIHPTVGILVRSNGEVFVPATSNSKAHWTFGHSNGRGYLRVRINGNRYLVHRLVAETFIPNPDGLKEVDHINRCTYQNDSSNLRWSNRKDNCRNTEHFDRVTLRGGSHWCENKCAYMREYGSRRCKTHKNIMFSDGKRRFVPNSEALLLLAIPVNQRIFIKK